MNYQQAWKLFVTNSPRPVTPSDLEGLQGIRGEAYVAEAPNGIIVALDIEPAKATLWLLDLVNETHQEWEATV